MKTFEEWWNGFNGTNTQLATEDEEVAEVGWKACESELTAAVQAAQERMREKAALVLDNGSFIHKDAPDAVWARQVAALIRALPLDAAGPPPSGETKPAPRTHEQIGIDTMRKIYAKKVRTFNEMYLVPLVELAQRWAKGANELEDQSEFDGGMSFGLSECSKQLFANIAEIKGKQ